MDVQKTIDNVGKLLDCVHTLTLSDVLVGVPAEKAGRRDTPINNAQLARIHEFGSPAQNIPARPFLFPAVRKVKPQVVAEMKKGAQDCLLGRGNVDVTLNRVGLLARNAAVNEITDPAPPFTPLKPATIRARLRKTAAGRRKLRGLSKIKTAAGWRSGDPALLQWAGEKIEGDMNIHPLIDSGQLRAALTYVIRKGGA